MLAMKKGGRGDYSSQQNSHQVTGTIMFELALIQFLPITCTTPRYTGTCIALAKEVPDSPEMNYKDSIQPLRVMRS
jgi:hypothetical protein